MISRDRKNKCLPPFNRAHNHSPVCPFRAQAISLEDRAERTDALLLEAQQQVAAQQADLEETKESFYVSCSQRPYISPASIAAME